MLTFTPRRRRMRRRIEHLPVAKHTCEQFGVWVRKPRITGALQCVVCGKV